MIETLKVIVCLAFLVYASYLDLRTRRIPNKVWTMMLVAGSFCIVPEIFMYGQEYLVRILLSFVSATIIMILLFRLKAFGGADAKALIVISVLFPMDLFAFQVFMNAVIISVLVPIYLFLRNLMHSPIREMIRKPTSTIIGYWCPEDSVKDRHVLVMDKRVVDGKVLVSPILPFVVFITAGFIAAVVWKI